MRLEIMVVAIGLGLAAPAQAQWTSVCIRYTTRIRTCSATYVAPPAPARRMPAPASASARALIALETFDEQESVFGLWRATGVAFESHGERTLLEVRVTGTTGGIRLAVPAAMRLPWTTFELTRIAPLVYRGTDRARSIVTFRVAGGRAELAVTGAGGDGLVTYQFDEHGPPR
jgi:hypothetical protein